MHAEGAITAKGKGVTPQLNQEPDLHQRCRGVTLLGYRVPVGGRAVGVVSGRRCSCPMGQGISDVAIARAVGAAISRRGGKWITETQLMEQSQIHPTDGVTICPQ